jgi:hypothetical protein
MKSAAARSVENMPEVIENTWGRVFITFCGPQAHGALI